MTNPAQHTVDATALIAPLTSIWVTGASILSLILTTMGIIWYGLQIFTWFEKRRIKGQ